ncbi:MAG TPA: DMT family transporter [Spirochaetota bacterium]|nr:DMT family transporter [Spirochaetota bacterium]
MNDHALKGIVLIALSALAFALSTVFAKFVTTQSAISGIEIAFFRFAAGLAVIVPYMLARKKTFRAVEKRYVALRGVSNAVAVIFFYLGIKFTTVTNANMLNMTYPVFVYLMAPFINRERGSWRGWVSVALTIAGSWLIMMPGFAAINAGDVFSLLSAVVAGVAVCALRESRKYDDSEVILFHLMAIGTAVCLVATLPNFVVPQGMMIVHIALTTLFALVGQVFITEGYRFIDAGPGALVSASRVLFAGVLGAVVFADALTVNLVAGGALIMLSLAGVSLNGGRKEGD